MFLTVCFVLIRLYPFDHRYASSLLFLSAFDPRNPWSALDATPIRH
jgi:hypothetical protein